MSAVVDAMMSNAPIVNKMDEVEEVNDYAVYIFNINKHHITAESDNNDIENSKRIVDHSSSLEAKPPDSDQSSVCLSLLETNLEAEQETVVRCHLLNTFSIKENLSFENEGKYVTLKFSDESKDTFGCYYHCLSKDLSSSVIQTLNALVANVTDLPTKKHLFFICLIGPADGVMESFCSELGTFCCSLLPLLDPEVLENQKDVQQKLKRWYYYSIRYIERCIEMFQDDIVVLFQSALCGKINIKCQDENIKWDLERLSEACSLTNALQTSVTQSNTSPNPSLSVQDSIKEYAVHLEVNDAKITCDKELIHSSYCEMWLEKLMSCKPTEYVALRSILESFRLKTIQDLNTLKRLLQRAENDYYSFFRAYQFLKSSGYEDILLLHVKQEATWMCSEEILEIINCLSDFMKDKSGSEACKPLCA